MAGQDSKLSEHYASPNLRWALLLEDHPGATRSFELRPGHELGVPEAWGGKDDFCLATITFPRASMLAPVSAFKSVEEVLEEERWTGDRNSGTRQKQKVRVDPTPELWQKLCTQTLGRALKAAGYPDDMPELKALIVWRKRLGEIELMMGGKSVGALGSGDEYEELEGAAKADPEAVGHDDRRQPELEAPSGAIEVEARTTNGNGSDDTQDWKEPTEEDWREMHRALGKLKRTEQKAVEAWAKEHVSRWPRPMYVADVQKVLDRIKMLTDSQPVTTPAGPDPEEVPGGEPFD